jgi:hypothetical protein
MDRPGAQYESHCAFLPLSTAAPPEVLTPGWVRNPIDQCILTRLENGAMAPSAEADRGTLIRRVFLDLIGLLPTPEEVREFEGDSRPEAYPALVERLLASPHYGERWGRHWLDQARYADSNGYTIDGDRMMWPERDWVIQALTADMPLDQFSIEQLDGDLLPNPTKGQRVATAFHRNTLINEEGGTSAEQFRVESVIDRVNTTGAVWLGLTVGCAQCHTHKVDPIPHRECYEMLAFFKQSADINNKGATVEVRRGELFGKLEANPLPEFKAEDLPRMTGRPVGEQTKKALIVNSLNVSAPAKPGKKPEATDEPALVMVMKEVAKPRETFLLLRGAFLRPDLKLGPLQPGGALGGQRGV